MQKRRPPRHKENAAARPGTNRIDYPQERYTVAPTSTPAQIRLRRHAAARTCPLKSGVRDPLLEQPDRDREPCTFGLTPRELAVEASRLASNGWAQWEIELTLLLAHPGGAQ